VQTLPPASAARLRRRLAVSTGGTVVLLVLFAALTVVGALAARDLFPAGALLVEAGLAGLVVLPGILRALRGTRRSLSGDAIARPEGGRALVALRRQRRLAWLTVLLVIAGGVVAVVATGDIGWQFLAVLLALSLVCVASIPAAVVRSLTRLLPP
jgi:hypothetical protein